MNNNLSVILKKFSVPAIFFLVGLLIVIIGIVKQQDATFMMAAVLLFAASLLSILYSTGRLSTRMAYIIGIVAGVGAAVTLYMSGDSVIDTKRYMDNRDYCIALSIQNLQDIRTIQKKYAERNGVYIDNWEDLVDYARNGKMDHIVMEGSAPDTFLVKAEHEYLVGLGISEKNDPYGDNKITEKQAYYLAKWEEGPRYNRYFKGFVRDTTEVNLADRLFRTESYERSREVAGFPAFSPDSLPFIPFTNGQEKWKLETVDSVLMGEATVPALQVSGKIPFGEHPGKKHIELSFGSLTTNDLDGSWEQ